MLIGVQGRVAPAEVCARVPTAEVQGRVAPAEVRARVPLTEVRA
ncbi:MAG: hypothetical protein U0R52_03830 [Solirubrobacterales bacterium]